MGVCGTVDRGPGYFEPGFGVLSGIAMYITSKSACAHFQKPDEITIIPITGTPVGRAWSRIVMADPSGSRSRTSESHLNIRHYSFEYEGTRDSCFGCSIVKRRMSAHVFRPLKDTFQMGLQPHQHLRGEGRASFVR